VDEHDRLALALVEKRDVEAIMMEMGHGRRRSRAFSAQAGTGCAKENEEIQYLIRLPVDPFGIPETVSPKTLDRKSVSRRPEYGSKA
jgi:hypothetical protein